MENSFFYQEIRIKWLLLGNAVADKIDAFLTGYGFMVKFCKNDMYLVKMVKRIYPWLSTLVYVNQIEIDDKITISLTLQGERKPDKWNGPSTRRHVTSKLPPIHQHQQEQCRKTKTTNI